MFLSNFIVSKKKEKVSKKKNFPIENVMTSTVAVKSIALFEGPKEEKDALVPVILQLNTDIRINNEAINLFFGFLTSNCSSFW